MTESILQFPCEFILKVFGLASDEFEINALTIIRKYVPDLAENSIQTRKSKDNKYLSLTITMSITSREQIDNIYRELSANPHVLMTL